ncbi:hypothetical protein C8A03DRAFT_33131 [Achaetomium macrosporum]|uniref:Transmembrane protein n=1 Tax=Achaetomium macrosporum TaxID=79813 RepID=A0AAN7CCM1_9PEZI|nr:hypothetical protein C8A03DRAFT_33131 [Achaetomium macrosporum]
MLPTLVRRLAQAAKPQLSATASNPTYKLKKVWPPDMKTMTAQQQLRLEKKYKRRLKLATARPRWDKFVRLAQLFTMTFVVSYMVLFMDWKDVPTPFEPAREKFWSFFGVFTEETRTISPSDKPPSQSMSRQ